MGQAGYTKLQVVDNTTMENTRVVDERYRSSIIGIFTASANCDVLRFRNVVLESNLNQDCVGKILYRLVQE